MFDNSSRYFGLEISSITLIEGDGVTREAPYVKRRFIPPDEGMTTLLEHTVNQGDRLDNITAHYLGDPTQFWQVCDANGVMRPDDLTETAGRIIKIALPSF